MTEQAKSTPPASQLPTDMDKSALANGLRWLAVIGFVVFAGWAFWEFILYAPQEAMRSRFFLDPARHPNSLAVVGWRDYFAQFGERGAIDPMVWQAWRWWTALLAVTWLFSLFVFQSLSRVGRSLLGVCVLLGAYALDKICGLMFPVPSAIGPLCVWAIGLLFIIKTRVRNPFRKSLRRLPAFTARWSIGIPVLLLMGLGFLAASTPVVQSDGLRYHIPATVVWLHQESFQPIPGMAFSQFPFLIEMWFLQAMRFDNEILAKLWHFTFFLLALGITWSATRRFAQWCGVKDRRFLASLAVALAVTIPALTITATWSFIDAGVTCFLVAASFAHAIWWRNGKLRHLLLAAVLTGFLIGTKYTMIVPAAFLGVGVLACPGPSMRGDRWRYALPERLMNGLIFGFFSLLIASPWFLRNWFQLGNPVYPLMNDVFNAPGWDAESAALWASQAAHKGVGKEWSLLVEALRGAIFDWDQFEQQSIGLTPLLLAPLGLGGLLLLAAKRGGWWLFHALFIAVNVVLWFKTYQSNRMLMPVIVLAIPAMVVGAAWVGREWRPLWLTTLIAVGVMCVYQGLWITRYFLIETNAPQLALGYWDHNWWRSEKINYFEATLAMDFILPDPLEPVLVVGETRRHHMPLGVVMSDWYDPPALRRFLEGARTPADVSAALADAGIEYLLFNHAELFPPGALDLIRRGDLEPMEVWETWAMQPDRIAPRSNLGLFRTRFSDGEALLWVTWLRSVDHEVLWSDQGAVEIWRIH